MAKALFGTYIPADSLRLLDEIQLLRRRVAELEAALDAAEQAHPAPAEDEPATA